MLNLNIGIFLFFLYVFANCFHFVQKDGGKIFKASFTDFILNGLSIVAAAYQ